MKTQTDKIPEQQSADAPKVQQEPSTGGTATIVDNRPSTAYQRKLRETMNAHTTQKTAPIQRKTPKGSSRFQQIATAMGEKHGVDTSGLSATHNSSFPGKLNAEATIQGNKIHFAPGRDTHYNIRHEVAHAIDNTLNGTPKGDRVVNGQKIDTTREKVVDRMAKEPVTQRRGIATLSKGTEAGKGSNGHLFHPLQATAATQEMPIQRLLRFPRLRSERTPRQPLSLGAIINDPYAVPYLRAFLISEFSVENIDFIMACRELAPERFGTPNYSVLGENASIEDIYNRFIMQGGSEQLNVSFDDMDRFEGIYNPARAAANGGPVQMSAALYGPLHNIYNAVFALINRDTYMRFTSSDLYTKAMSYFGIKGKVRKVFTKKLTLAQTVSLAHRDSPHSENIAGYVMRNSRLADAML